MNLILGILIVVACIAGGYTMEGGHLAALYQPAEFVIIAGAALGAFITSNPLRVVKKCVHGLGKMLKGSPYDRDAYAEVLALIYAILLKIRKEGMMAIEMDVEEPEKSAVFGRYPAVASNRRTTEFICDYFRLMVSGIMNAYEIENLLDIDLEASSHAAHKPSAAMQFLSDSLPAFGIIAAVMGVVITMAAIGGPQAEVGHKIAAALVGTFLGILLAYGFLGPVSKLLQNIAEDEEQFFACIKTCIVAYLNGYPPKMVIEFGRMSIAPDLRPSTRELEDYVQLPRKG